MPRNVVLKNVPKEKVENREETEVKQEKEIKMEVDDNVRFCSRFWRKIIKFRKIFPYLARVPEKRRKGRRKKIKTRTRTETSRVRRKRIKRKV